VLPPPPKAQPQAPKTRPDTNTRPKHQPPYAVVILNDPVHSFGYVMDVLCTVFGYPTEKSYKLTMEAHHSGRAIVWSGPMETAEFKRDRIQSFGPDTYAMKPVTFPLGCFIEPLPQ
jgi:ATP-dependent Clp protease adaptor protein ClpS